MRRLAFILVPGPDTLSVTPEFLDLELYFHLDNSSAPNPGTWIPSKKLFFSMLPFSVFRYLNSTCFLFPCLECCFLVFCFFDFCSHLKKKYIVSYGWDRWHISSLTRDWTSAPCSGSLKSQPLPGNSLCHLYHFLLFLSWFCSSFSSLFEVAT